jgi:hypothetical protein
MSAAADPFDFSRKYPSTDQAAKVLDDENIRRILKGIVGNLN